MPVITTDALELPELDEGEPISRADLVFYGVDHSGASYEARVFLNNPGADENAERDSTRGYAGSFVVFGHGGCYGDEGHCLPDQRHTDAFDRRPPHPLTPYTKTVVATEAIKRAISDAGTTEITVTVVPVVAEPFEGQAVEDKSLVFSEVRLLTYADSPDDD
jgi:tyrosinase